MSISSNMLLIVIIFGLIGILVNLGTVFYMRRNFDMSKTIYKLLLHGSIIIIMEFVIKIIIATYLLLDVNELGCMLFQIAFVAPRFFLHCFLLGISILRCLSICKLKNHPLSRLNLLQKPFIIMVSPLPFAYIITVFIIRVIQNKALGLLHQVYFEKTISKLLHDVPQSSCIPKTKNWPFLAHRFNV